MPGIALCTCLLAASLPTSAFPSRSLHSRRSVLAHAATALSTPLGASAIVRGDAVDDAAAAQVGAVGLWIDLTDCSVCRKGLPATCSGTLIAPDLVLSASHCIDFPRELNGTLDRVVFGADMFDTSAPTRKVAALKTTADYGLSGQSGGDLVLIKLASPAPASWRPVELPLGLLPGKAELKEAERRGSPFYPDGLGLPSVSAYGYGQQSTAGTRDASAYSAGKLAPLPPPPTPSLTIEMSASCSLPM